MTGRQCKFHRTSICYFTVNHISHPQWGPAGVQWVGGCRWMSEEKQVVQQGNLLGNGKWVLMYLSICCAPTKECPSNVVMTMFGLKLVSACRSCKSMCNVSHNYPTDIVKLWTTKLKISRLPRQQHEFRTDSYDRHSM